MDGGHEETLKSGGTPQATDLHEEGARPPATMEEALARVQTLSAEKKALEEWVRGLLDENREFASRYAELEEQNNSLANLYVASYQLHSTLDFDVVLRTMREIIANLVGAEAFRIFLLDERSGHMTSATQQGYRDDFVSQPVVPGAGILGAVASSGEPYFAPASRPESTEALQHPLAAVPLKVGEKIIGLISVERLLAHKPLLDPVDYELFSVLADHAATALFSSQLHAESERTLTTLRSALKRAVEPAAEGG
jgi:transcriptional regulator with GAF, ATPase, and Fis domain